MKYKCISIQGCCHFHVHHVTSYYTGHTICILFHKAFVYTHPLISCRAYASLYTSSVSYNVSCYFAGAGKQMRGCAPGAVSCYFAGAGKQILRGFAWSALQRYSLRVDRVTNSSVQYKLVFIKTLYITKNVLYKPILLANFNGSDIYYT